jgi:hypothetical protein
MADTWEESISCALQCNRCNKRLTSKDQRYLSIYDHEAICTVCKKEEEARPDYEETSKNMIGQCLAETELLYSDPEGYCLYHFHPYTCDKK